MVDSMREAFERAYAEKRWHNGSGSGSQPANTIVWRAFLEGFIRQNAITSVLDIGCGDMRVMEGLGVWDQVKYTGMDIVPLGYMGIAQGQLASHTILADALTEDWPDADLVVVKDVVQHWPADAIRQLMPALTQRSHWLLVTDMPGAWHVPSDIRPGEYRAVDLREFVLWAPELLRYSSRSRDRIDTKVVYGW